MNPRRGPGPAWAVKLRPMLRTPSPFRLLHALLLALAATAAAPAAAQACGRLTLANMNWQSAELLAQVDRLILQSGYGCQVDLVPGEASTVTVVSAEPLNLDDVRAAVDEAGYDLVG